MLILLLNYPKDVPPPPDGIRFPTAWVGEGPIWQQAEQWVVDQRKQAARANKTIYICCSSRLEQLKTRVLLHESDFVLECHKVPRPFTVTEVGT